MQVILTKKSLSLSGNLNEVMEYLKKASESYSTLQDFLNSHLH